MCLLLIKISKKFVPKGGIYNTSIGTDNGLVPTGDKPLSKAIMTWFADTYMHHSSSVSKYIGPWDIQMKFRLTIFKLILVIGGWCISIEIALGWMVLDLTDD